MRFQRPAKHKKPWTADDDAKIVAMATTNSVPHIARELGRTSVAVETRAAYLKVKTLYRMPAHRTTGK